MVLECASPTHQLATSTATSRAATCSTCGHLCHTRQGHDGYTSCSHTSSMLTASRKLNTMLCSRYSGQMRRSCGALLQTHETEGQRGRGVAWGMWCNRAYFCGMWNTRADTGSSTCRAMHAAVMPSPPKPMPVDASPSTSASELCATPPHPHPLLDE